MKQLLSGTDWQVSHFLPGEVDAFMAHIRNISNGELYGAEFIAAQVPGDVQSDALDAGLIDDIHYGFNARNAEWTYQRDWLYVKRFTPQDHPYKRCMLCFDGVDDVCQVFLNGTWLGNHEIAWMPFGFDITDKLRFGEENCLCVLVKAARDAECQWGYTSKVRHLKARFAYGWDWCTRLVPLGIWKDVFIRYEQNAAFSDLQAYTDVDYTAKKAVIRVQAELVGETACADVRFTLQYPDGTGKTAAGIIENNTAHAEFCIENAQLWYPNGMGAQPLYQISAVLCPDWDKRTINIGLRHIEWKQTEGATEDALPYQPYINGRRVYLQGYNFTPIRQLYGRIQKEVYERRIALVKRAGANYLRIWGGGLLEREELYDACDRNGILLMQELFQSSASGNNHPPRDDAYISMLCKATASAVLQKRNHPSLLSWCGGNELCFRGGYMDAQGNILVEGAEGMEGLTCDVSGSYWIPLHENYPTLAAMRTVVNELDPGRQWFHTSGSGPKRQNASLEALGGDMHDVHGPWTILGPTAHYTFYNALDMMIHHEFGTQGSASVQTLEEITPKKYLWPLDETNPFVNFHGRMFARARSLLKPYFGEIGDHRTYALASRFMQWEQLRYALESHHRLGARCAGACLWHLGEPWPNVIENATIDVYEQVKPAYYGEMAAFRPLHLSAHYDSVIHKNQMDVTFALHNTCLSDFTGRLTAQIYAPDGTLCGQFDSPCSAKSDSVNAFAAKVSFTNLPDGVFFLRQTLYDDAHTVLETGYSIHATQDIPYAPLLTQPECSIKASLDGDTLKLKNLGNAVVSGLTVECGNDNTVDFSDGCIMLLPGEERDLSIRFHDHKPASLYISGFGVPYQELPF